MLLAASGPFCGTTVYPTQTDQAAAHPLAALPEQVDGEELARQLDAVSRERR